MTRSAGGGTSATERVTEREGGQGGAPLRSSHDPRQHCRLGTGGEADGRTYVGGPQCLPARRRTDHGPGAGRRGAGHAMRLESRIHGRPTTRGERGRRALPCLRAAATHGAASHAAKAGVQAQRPRRKSSGREGPRFRTATAAVETGREWSVLVLLCLCLRLLLLAAAGRARILRDNLLGPAFLPSLRCRRRLVCLRPRLNLTARRLLLLLSVVFAFCHGASRSVCPMDRSESSIECAVPGRRGHGAYLNDHRHIANLTARRTSTVSFHSPTGFGAGTFKRAARLRDIALTPPLGREGTEKCGHFLRQRVPP